MKKSPPEFVYLASQSPRRQQLLDQLGIRHQGLLPDESEDAEALEAVREGEAPAQYVRRVTRAKMRAAAARLKRRDLPAAPILVADTTVALGRRILGKPADAAEAAGMLHELSGKVHRVITGVGLRRGGVSRFELSVSKVRFAPMSERAIQAYVASGEPFGKAGAYAIQGPIAAWIEHIEGSYSGIMGLPLFETAQLLRQAKVMK